MSRRLYHHVKNTLDIPDHPPYPARASKPFLPCNGHPRGQRTVHQPGHSDAGYAGFPHQRRMSRHRNGKKVKGLMKSAADPQEPSMKKPNEEIPLYKQMINRLHEQIETGFYKPGQMIPSERALCKSYGVSRITVRRCLSEMIHNGILYRQQGRGSFVEMKILAFIGLPPLAFVTGSFPSPQEDPGCSTTR